MRKGLQNYFGVRTGVERNIELTGNFFEIVYLAIVHHDVSAIVRNHGLIGGIGQIQNTETLVSEVAVIVRPIPCGIRTPMSQGFGHYPNGLRPVS